MVEFMIVVICGALVGCGLIIGSISATKDITGKQINDASLQCEASEGLYKVNVGSSQVIAYCKNNTKFELNKETDK